MIGGRDSYRFAAKDGAAADSYEADSYERNEDRAEATARARQRSFDDAMAAQIRMAQVAWLRRIFWLMLIVWVILPALAGVLWAFLL